MKILDCTIRDGSYATNYRWEPDIIQHIVRGLSEQGVSYIEIGNGTGLGAYRKFENAMSDDEYFQYAIPSKGTANIGAFFMPNVGTKDDILRLSDAGADFVRIGVNATETERAYEYIEYAKSLGLYVFTFFMKTYAISNYQFALSTQRLIEHQTDAIYIVDSAGCMLPSQVHKLVSDIRSFYDIPVGFHGHNNLLLANANSLAAAEAGAEFIDATLGGLGRGAGNAQLESLVAILQKAGYVSGDTNIYDLSDLYEQTIARRYNASVKGSSKREISEGATHFHSLFTGILERTAEKFKINPEQLMNEVCKINVVNPSEELFELAATNIVNGRDSAFFAPKFYHKKY